MKRDSTTDEPLSFEDEQLQSFRNHPHSEISKARGKSSAMNAAVSEGDIVCLKDDGSKRKARDFYLLTDVNYETHLRFTSKRFCGDQLQSKKYVVKLADINPTSSSKEEEEVSDDDTTLCKSDQEPKSKHKALDPKVKL